MITFRFITSLGTDEEEFPIIRVESQHELIEELLKLGEDIDAVEKFTDDINYDLVKDINQLINIYAVSARIGSDAVQYYAAHNTGDLLKYIDEKNITFEIISTAMRNCKLYK